MDKNELQEMLSQHLTKTKEEIKSVVAAEIVKVTREMDEIKKSIQFLSDKYDEIILEKEDLKLEVNLLKNTVQEQSLKIETMEQDRRQCNKRVNALDNSARYNKLELHGISQPAGERPSRIAYNILKITDPTLNDSEILDSFRVEKKGQNRRPKIGPIVVKLKTKEKRDECYYNRKKLAGVNFKEMGVEAERIYINENLCPFTRKLLFDANNIRKKKNYISIWTNGGVIKTKKNSDAPILTIQDDKDLELIV